ncbi:transposable element Tc1 transposase [Trichonephila clavipes]|nr:transposable element Tc1 transposase [Trichonephila clavipes]
MTVQVVQSVNGLCNARFTIWLSGTVGLREYHCLMLATGLHVLPGQETSKTSVEDWKRVASSDESQFQLLNADGRLRIRRQAHEAMDRACQVGTVQGHVDSIMFWGAFLWHCFGCLVRVATSLNAIWCVELLEDHLHPFMLFCHPHYNGVF